MNLMAQFSQSDSQFCGHYSTTTKGRITNYCDFHVDNFLEAQGTRKLVLAVVKGVLKKADHKPDSVSNNVDPYHLSSLNITIEIKPPTLQHWAHNPKKLVYMALHRIEFT
ncbi:hypothetical protein GCM10022259_35070 [Aquimarina mytili]